MGTGLFQPGHLILILVIALIIFGPGKLPELGSALGQGIREFKRSVEHVGNDSSEGAGSAALPHPPPTAADAGTTGPAATSSLACPGCQATMPTTARFCTRCGRQLAEP